jgi:hypothetical protein
VITLEEARALVGKTVIYLTGRLPKHELGVVTSVNDSLVFVRYGGDVQAKATHPNDLFVEPPLFCAGCCVPWRRSWQEVPERWAPSATLIDYMRGLPAVAQDLHVRFPPNCLVRTRYGTNTVSAGELLVVTGHSPQGAGVWARSEPEAIRRHWLEPHEAEVVGYWHGLLPREVEKLLWPT